MIRSEKSKLKKNLSVLKIPIQNLKHIFKILPVAFNLLLTFRKFIVFWEKKGQE